MSKVMETVQMARMGAIGGYKLAALLALAALSLMYTANAFEIDLRTARIEAMPPAPRTKAKGKPSGSLKNTSR